MMMKTLRFCLVVCALPLFGLTACESDEFQAGDTASGSSDLGQLQDLDPSRDVPVLPQGEWFTIKGGIDFTPEVGCQSFDANIDCKGLLVWGIWTRPLTDPDPGDPVFLDVVPEAQKGGTFEARVPIAPVMYLGAFLDDNGTASFERPLPDAGDPLHLDLEPFFAHPDETVTRNLTFVIRMP
ncbi:MAG: hypothetical protein JRH20_23510 [Deltaproteobacteria bacterium]|nr:hypothetical protein [Deltaproteobacteria bacterium]